MNLDEDDLKNFRDENLLKIVSKNDEMSEKAFIVFYDRYIDDLYKVLWRLPTNPIDLAEKAMEEVYFKAETFEVDEKLSPRAKRGRTLSWLRSIARRIFLQELRAKKLLCESLSLDTDGSEETVTDIVKKLSSNGIVNKSNLAKINLEIEDSLLGIEDNQNNNISTERKILREVLAKLPEREREILLTYLAEFDPRIENQKLPREKIKELSEKYNITPTYIRKIKERTFKAVYEECKSKEALLRS